MNLRILANHPLLQKALAIYQFAAQRIEKAQLKQVASSLTLTTLLSIVPALAIITAAFSAFPLFDGYREHFEQLILSSFLPEQYSSQIIGYVKEFATKATSMTIFGVLGLAISAILCIATIDSALNNTFEVTELRKLWQRLLIYWALLTLGPLLITLSLAGSTYITRLAFLGTLSELKRWLFPFSQFLLQSCALALLYKYVPNCKILWKDALLSGLLVSLIMTLFRWGFGIYVLRGSYGTIYGAFAAIPVLLTWTYLMWMFVLAGAALTATLPILRAKRYSDLNRPGDKFLSALVLLKVLSNAKEVGNPKLKIDVLTKSIASYPEATEHILEELAKDNYVARIADDDDISWALLADAKTVTLQKAFERFCIDPKNSLLKTNKIVDASWLKIGFSSSWLSLPLNEVFEFSLKNKK